MTKRRKRSEPAPVAPVIHLFKTPVAAAADGGRHINTPAGRMRSAVLAADIYAEAMRAVNAQPAGCGTCTAASVAAMIVVRLAELNGLEVEQALQGVGFLADELVARRRHVAPGPETVQ